MSTLNDFFQESLKDINNSLKENNLPIDVDSLGAIAVVWSTVGTDEVPPSYNRMTMEKYTGRKLIHLFSKLADIEEEEAINESKNI